MKYHKKNEEKWGFQTWAKNHTRALVIGCIIIGIILAGVFGVTTSKVLAIAAKWTRVEALLE